MIRVFILNLFVLVVLGLLAAKSIVYAKPDERVVLFRLGKFIGVCQPGINIIVPFVDRAIKVRVDQLSGHERMSEKQLTEKISELYR